MNVLLPVLYSQTDERWKDVFLGYNTRLPYTIGFYGCFISCLAMVASYYGGHETPLTINQKLLQLGPGNGFTANSGTYVLGSISRLFPQIGERNNFTPASLTDLQMNEIKTAVMRGFPVVLQIDSTPSSFFVDTHFVVATGINPNDENDITIADSLVGRFRSLKDYLGRFRPNARKAIEQYLVYTGPLSIIATNPQTGQDDPLVCEHKSIRDLLVTKASSVDEIYRQLGIDPSLWGTNSARDQALQMIRHYQGVG